MPAYRTMDALKVMDGTAQREAGMTETLYLMPWSTMFPLGISLPPSVSPISALAAHLDYQRERVGAAGTAIKDDPYVMYAIGEAAADINAARQEILANADRIGDIVDSGKEVSFADRAAGRRTQIRAVGAVMAVDQIFSRSGGNAMRMDKPLQRYWRDAHTGLAHAIHVPGTAYHASALSRSVSNPRAPAGDDLTGPRVSLFKSLGYVTIQTADIARWRRFAFQLIGFAEGKGPDPDALYLRDGRARRPHRCHPGDTDRIIIASGWEVRDRAELQQVRKTLDGAGVPYKQLSQGEADDRRVEEVLTFDDPAGNTLEVFHGAVLDHSPVVTLRGAVRHRRPGHGPRGATRAGRQRTVRVLHRHTGIPVPRVLPVPLPKLSSARSGSGSSASTNATTAWRSHPR